MKNLQAMTTKSKLKKKANKMNNKFKLIVPIVSALLLANCTATATMSTAPAVVSFAAIQDPIPGRWGVIAELGEIPSRYQSSEYACSGWTYTVDSANSFRDSILATMDVAFEESVPLDSMPSPQSMTAQDINGVVVVTVSNYSSTLTWLTGFWTVTARAEASIRIGVEVRDNTGTRIAGFSNGAQRSAQADSGGCAAGSSAISRALSNSTQELMEGALERLQDNERVRQVPETI